MDLDQIEGNCKQLKSNIQQQWVKLTEHDLGVVRGKHEALADSAPHSMRDGMGDASNGGGEPGNGESDEMDDSGKHTSIPAPKPMPNPIPDEMGTSKITKK